MSKMLELANLWEIWTKREVIASPSSRPPQDDKIKKPT